MKKLLVLFILCLSNTSFGIVSFPKNYDSSTPLFLVLHGCKQSDKIIMNDTFFLEKGKEKAIFIVPSQSILRNIDHCWNWFAPLGRSPISGSEINNIVSNLLKFKRKHKLQKNPVFVMGMSAGGAMAMNLMACYPEFFDGAAVHSGLAYKINDSIFGLTKLISNAPRKSPMELATAFRSCSKQLINLTNKKYLVFHGTEDERVHVGHMYAIENQIVDAHDLSDDGLINQSNQFSFSEMKYNPKNKFNYTIRAYKLDNNVELKVYEIDRLKHDWSGGDYRVERNDPKGPDASDIILDYFID